MYILIFPSSIELANTQRVIYLIIMLVWRDIILHEGRKKERQKHSNKKVFRYTIHNSGESDEVRTGKIWEAAMQKIAE